MVWLSQGMPLTLLIDLLASDGPDSAVILGAESGDTTWIPHRAA
jgi:hypothetical protein